MRVTSFYVENFGCRATQADGASIERQFSERGLEKAEGPEQAQIVVLNTCTVTAAADQDARAAIRRIQRQNPECQIVVTGCYAQRAAREVADLPGVSYVIGNSHKHQLAELTLASMETATVTPPVQSKDAALDSRLSREDRPRGNQIGLCAADSSFVELDRLTTRGKAATFVSDIFAHTELLAAPVFDAATGRTRPNLKVQDGCDNRCSFCVIPYVRGQSRSLPLGHVISQVKTLVDAGYREVVISGINLGRWGRDLDPARHVFVPVRHGKGSGKPGLADLIRAILEETGLEKLRISSVEPMDWNEGLIELVASSPRIAKHAHVPMQSGSDRVLRAMHRKYRPWHYRERIEKIRAAMPKAAIGADVMVGFPGETEADFTETRRMIEELPFTYLHVFTYSSRPGTPAAGMQDQVRPSVARERSRILRELAFEKKLGFMRSLASEQVEAITLGVFDGTYTEALTDNYLKLRIGGRVAANQWIRAQVEEVREGELIGRYRELCRA
jgi:threonylcarbamoyladenosine tRNA methylthiotransferase MtaB